MASKKVNITNADNKVTVTNSNNKIEVIDTNVASNVEVTQPITSIVEVKTLGPKGDRGVQGETGSQGIQGPAGTDGGGVFTRIDGGVIYATTSSLQLSGSLNISGSFTTNDLTYPTTDGDAGDSLITDGDGNLSFTRPSVLANVKNISGVTLIKGTPVHATGSLGNSSTVVPASASAANSMPATFILNETLVDGAEGTALLSGFINGVNTSLFEAGDVLYVGSNGGYTNIRPTGSDNLIQNLGIVTKVHSSNGSGYIYGSGRSNDVPNLPHGKIWVGSANTVTSSIVHLDELNSIVQISGSLSVSGSISFDSIDGGSF
jgi:hypothetical protein